MPTTAGLAFSTARVIAFLRDPEMELARESALLILTGFASE
jgi:hypothetical protein